MKEFSGRIIYVENAKSTSFALIEKNKKEYSFIINDNIKIESILFGFKIPTSRSKYPSVLKEARNPKSFTKIGMFKGFKSDSSNEEYFLAFESEILSGMWKVIQNNKKLFLLKIR